MIQMGFQLLSYELSPGILRGCLRGFDHHFVPRDEETKPPNSSAAIRNLDARVGAVLEKQLRDRLMNLNANHLSCDAATKSIVARAVHCPLTLTLVPYSYRSLSISP